MARHGSPMFEAYTRTLRRVYWAEFVEDQLSAARPASFRASLVDEPAADGGGTLAKAYVYHRHRGSTQDQLG